MEDKKINEHQLERWIIEQGQGFPEIGEFFAHPDGYGRVVDYIGMIFSGGPGKGNRCLAIVYLYMFDEELEGVESFREVRISETALG